MLGIVQVNPVRDATTLNPKTTKSPCKYGAFRASVRFWADPSRGQ